MIELNYLDGISSNVDLLKISFTPSIIEKPVFKTLYVNKTEIFTIEQNDNKELQNVARSVVKLKNTDRIYYCSNNAHDLARQINSPLVV